MIAIENLALEEWLRILKPYQRNAIIQLVTTFGEENAAERWLTSTGPIETAQFGGDNSDPNKIRSYWTNVKSEFDKLICGHEDYAEERKKLITGGKVISTGSVTSIATFIAPTVGLSISILVPALILLLHIAAKITVKAYCSINSDTGSTTANN